MPPPQETWKAIVERERRLTEERVKRLREMRLGKEASDGLQYVRALDILGIAVQLA